MGSMASAAMGLIKKATKGDGAYQKTLQTKTSPADVIMWSGSKDEQTSQDATINGQATGAMARPAAHRLGRGSGRTSGSGRTERQLTSSRPR